MSSEPGAADPAPGDFGAVVLDIVASVPPGLVVTYGDIAAMLGIRGARAVGNIMARQASSVPWWRVVRADGSPPSGHADRALPRYREEGTPLVPGSDPYRIDLRSARWQPDA